MSTINLATASKDNPTVADFLKFRARIESHEELYRKADNADPGDNVSLSGNLRDLDMMPGIVRIAGTPNDGGTSHKGTLTWIQGRPLLSPLFLNTGARIPIITPPGSLSINPTEQLNGTGKFPN